MDGTHGHEASFGPGTGAIREIVGMKRWMRLAARRHHGNGTPVNDVSKAAAEALAQLLKESRRNA
jgi:cysteine sulfinate desulfinase/cysteine desulfurase-like protein